jgi:sporulation protein YlmC with PRC-barrel domain
MDGMGVRHAGGLLALPVRHNGIDLGRAVDVLLDLDSGRALGLEVRCRDETRRFLPLGAARIESDATELASPLALLDDVAFYRSRGTGLRELRGVTVARAGRALGALADVLLEDSGTIDSLLVETASGRRRVVLGPSVSLVGPRRVSAA